MRLRIIGTSLLVALMTVGCESKSEQMDGDGAAAPAERAPSPSIQTATEDEAEEKYGGETGECSDDSTCRDMCGETAEEQDAACLKAWRAGCFADPPSDDPACGGFGAREGGGGGAKPPPKGNPKPPGGSGVADQPPDLSGEGDREKEMLPEMMGDPAKDEEPPKTP